MSKSLFQGIFHARARRSFLKCKWTDSGSQREWASCMLDVEGNAKYWIFKEDIKYDDHTFHPYYAFGRHKKGVFTVGQPGKEIIGFIME